MLFQKIFTESAIVERRKKKEEKEKKKYKAISHPVHEQKFALARVLT